MSQVQESPDVDTKTNKKKAIHHQTHKSAWHSAPVILVVVLLAIGFLLMMGLIVFRASCWTKPVEMSTPSLHSTNPNFNATLDNNSNPNLRLFPPIIQEARNNVLPTSPLTSTPTPTPTPTFSIVKGKTTTISDTKPVMDSITIKVPSMEDLKTMQPMSSVAPTFPFAALIAPVAPVTVPEAPAAVVPVAGSVIPVPSTAPAAVAPTTTHRPFPGFDAGEGKAGTGIILPNNTFPSNLSRSNPLLGTFASNFAKSSAANPLIADKLNDAVPRSTSSTISYDSTSSQGWSEFHDDHLNAPLSSTPAPSTPSWAAQSPLPPVVVTAISHSDTTSTTTANDDHNATKPREPENLVLPPPAIATSVAKPNVASNNNNKSVILLLKSWQEMQQNGTSNANATQDTTSDSNYDTAQLFQQLMQSLPTSRTTTTVQEYNPVTGIITDKLVEKETKPPMPTCTARLRFLTLAEIWSPVEPEWIPMIQQWACVKAVYQNVVLQQTTEGVQLPSLLPDTLAWKQKIVPWYLKRTGIKPRGAIPLDAEFDEKINNYSHTQGAVFVLDDGVVSGHSRLQLKNHIDLVKDSFALLSSSSLSADDKEKDKEKLPLHLQGTCVAGIVAARESADKGMMGVCPGLGIYSLQISSRGFTTIGHVLQAFDTVASLRPSLDFAIVHLGITLLHTQVPWIQDLLRTLDTLNIHLIQPWKPHAMSPSISVAGYDRRNMALTSYSDILQFNDECKADAKDKTKPIWAPAEQMLTLTPDGYGYVSGTCLGSALVAGIVARHLANPEALVHTKTPQAVRMRLEQIMSSVDNPDVLLSEDSLLTGEELLHLRSCLHSIYVLS